MGIVARLAVAAALGSALTASQIPVKVYTTADGLASNRVNKIVQDSHGYLWFCTNDGLSRFDGYGFTSYGPQHGLPLGSVNDLLEMPTGEYWLATGGGLVRFDPSSAEHKLTVFVPTDSVGARRILEIVGDGTGGLWCSTFDGLYRFVRAGRDHSSSPAGRFQRVEIGTPQSGVEPARINAVLPDRRGVLWIAAESGLYRLRAGGASERFTTSNGLPVNPVKTLIEDRQGRLWAGTHAGLCRIVTDAAAGGRIVERVYTTAEGLASNVTDSLFEASTGRLWVGAFGGLSEMLSPPVEKSRTFQSYTMANGLISNEINSIAEDRNGNLWVGSAEGAMKITQSNFLTFTAADGLPPVAPPSPAVRVTSIFEDGSGALYVTVGAGPDPKREPLLSRLEGDRFKSIFPNLPAGIATLSWAGQVVLLDRAGDWWIATRKGLARFAPPARFEQLAHMRVKAIYTTHDGLPYNEVIRIFEDSRGDIWLATFPNGLTRWDRRSASFRQDAGFVHPGFGQYVSEFGEDRGGDVWMGLYTGGVVRFRHGAFAHYGRKEGVGAGGISQMYGDRAGRFWVGTSRGGVTRIDGPQSDRPRFTTIGVGQGLSSDSVACITEDRWGRIYVGGARGIDRLDANAPSGGAITKHFTTADGLTVGNLDVAFADRAGNLWFGSSMGLSRLVPQADPPPSAPGILISGLRMRGERYPVSDLGVSRLSGIRLRPDQTQIEVSFLGLSLAAGEVLRYQYMLADADRDWGPLTTERTVNYAGLKPGSYRFLVRAVNSAGIGAPAPASVEFTLLAPVWQRWWFLTLCACAGIFGLYALHLSRVGRLLQLERIRTRIATDLHDDIGASLSQIAVVSEALSQRAGAEHRFREPLSQIASDSREMVVSMSDLVWSVDPGRDHLHDLVQRMRRFSGEMFTARNIQFRFSAPTSHLVLSIDQRRHIFLIFKECVNNVVRHSACSEAGVELTLAADALVLRVLDNGCGFDLLQAARGNGLSGMRARAAALGGEVEIAGGPNLGTAITLRVPLRRLRMRHWKSFFHLNRG